jgi:cobalt-zinc-cadmium efflux system outer membrane protein
MALLLVVSAAPSSRQSAGAQEQPAALSARQAVAEALDRHPLVRAAEHRLRGSAAHLRGARAPLNPEAVVQRAFGRDTGGTDEDISVSQVFELGGKRRFRGREAQGQERRAAAELEAARLEVGFQALSAYLGLQESSALREETAEFVRLAEQFRTAAAAQFTAGEVPRTQVIRSELEVAVRQQALDEVAAELETRALTLNSVLGRPLTQPLSLADALAEPPPAGTLESWRALAAARPEVQAARAELAARQAALGAARAESAPNLVVTGVHAHLDEWPGNSLRVGLVFPLWDRGSLRARREEARAAIAAGEAQLGESVRQAELEVRVAWSQAVQAAARLQRYRAGQLDRARTLADLAQAGYEAGHASFLELLDAQRALHESRAGYLRVTAEAARARLAVARAAGSPRLLDPGAGP